MTNKQKFIFEDLNFVLKNYPSKFLEGLKQKKILITGGTGWFGKLLLQFIIYLNKNFNFNINVFIPSRNPEQLKKSEPEICSNKEINLFKLDIAFEKIPDICNCNYIVHAATTADARFLNENPLQLANIIVNGTRNVLDFAIKNPPIKMLFISSGAIYGKQFYDISHMLEDNFNCNLDCLNPKNAYAEAKRYAEQLCAIYTKQFGLNITIARPFAFFGPYQNLEVPFAITDFIKNCIANHDIKILSDGSTVRSYMYAADLPIWLFKILLDGKTNEAYNIGSNVSITVKELAETIIKLFNPKLKIIIKGEKVNKENVNIYVPSIDKAINELGLKLSFNFEEGLKRTSKWHKLINQL